MSDTSPPSPVPPNREALLSMVGVHKENIYQMVRQILDDMEEAAPWEGLYYPPNDSQKFLRMENAFLDVIERIPPRLQKLTESFLLEGMDPEAEQVLGDAEFFFGAIHDNVSSEIQKLRKKLRALDVTSGSIALTPTERAFTCEITADLKGKYASSIMGAAATLIASGLWNGVEIEPILFPEKLEEFQRNELLVQVLQEVVGNINNLLEELPLAELVSQWEKEQRVDQYALTTLYSFLGNLGKLMKGQCRRALYSGDYHQIQKRENMLSSRINELTTLHHVTWGTVPKEAVGPGISIYPQMIQKATELAAILDLDIMRKIVGSNTVQDILSIVTVEKEQQKAESRDNPYLTIEPKASPLRQKLAPHLRSLVPLLYDEDLQKFLSLLLGSVQKRASLEVTRQRAQAGAPPLVPAIDTLDDSDILADGGLPSPALDEDPPTPSLDDVSFFDAEPEPPGGLPIFAPTEASQVATPTLAEPTPDFGEPAPSFAAPAATPPEAKFDGKDESFQISFDTVEPGENTASPDLTPSMTSHSPGVGLKPIADQSSPTDRSPNPFSASNADDALDAALPTFGESTEVTPPVDFTPQIDVGQPLVPEASDIFDRPSVSAPSVRDRPPTFTEPSATYDRPTFGPKDSPFEPKLSMDEVLSPLPEFDFPDLPEPDLPVAETPRPGSAGTSPSRVGPASFGDLEALKALDGILEDLLSSQNSHRKSFEMVHRLLERRKSVPPAMLEAMHPYLYDVLNMLVPQLHNLSETPEIAPERATELIEVCTFLCNKNMSPMQVRDEVLPTLGKLLGILKSLSNDAKKLVDRMASDSMAS